MILRRDALCPRCLYIDAELRGGVLRLIVRFSLASLLVIGLVLLVGHGRDVVLDKAVDLWMLWAPLVVLALTLPGPRVVCPRCDERTYGRLRRSRPDV